MQLSKMEYQACTILKDQHLIVFSPQDLQLLLKLSLTQTYNLMKALKKKRAIQKIGNNRFALTGSDELVMAASLHFPSYISFWSALSYYGFSDQLPKTIFLATTCYHSKINSFQYVTMTQNRFFGYHLIGKITLAEKEKAFVDSLLFPKYAGGIKEIKNCLSSAKTQLSLPKLIHYALKMKSKILLRRAGFLLEQVGIARSKLSLLKRSIGQGYEKLDQSLPRKNNWNAYWLLDVNVDDIH